MDESTILKNLDAIRSDLARLAKEHERAIGRLEGSRDGLAERLARLEGHLDALVFLLFDELKSASPSDVRRLLDLQPPPDAVAPPQDEK